MKNLILIIIITFLAACGKKEAQHQSSQMNKQGFQLRHSRVKELFVVVFEKNYSAEEWKNIFDLTKVLSTNKKTLRSIEGDDTEVAGAIRAPIIRKNAEILAELGAKSIFMMSWSAQDENCKIRQKEQLLFICKPRNMNNPLNGGLPTVIAPLEWIRPDPVRSDVKIPYLKILLRKDSGDDVSARYGLELRLKEEAVSETETWFKGDALPESESKFKKSDGTVAEQFFKFGYAEMTLGD